MNRNDGRPNLLLQCWNTPECAGRKMNHLIDNHRFYYVCSLCGNRVIHRYDKEEE